MKHATAVLVALIGVLIIGCYKAGERSEIQRTNRTDEESRGSQAGSDPRTGVEAYMDVRGDDLRACDLRDAGGIMDTLTFNRETLWPPPERLPGGFDPERLLQESMNPGLGVRELHRQGITGKGVNVAIIDHPMYLTHPEFAGKVVTYYDVGCPLRYVTHGTVVTSLLVGTHCGTAPEARVFYVAAPSMTGNSAYYAEALDRFIDYNRGLPDSERIRVVSVSARPSGPGSPFKKNRAKWDKAFERAQEEGILVLDASNHKGFISACWCDPNDPENPAKCTPGYPGLPDRYNPANLMAPTSLLATDFKNAPGVLEENNLTIQDPASLFVDASRFDLHLRPGAAAIDAGSSLNAPKLDRDRIARSQGNGIDIGAYEWHAEGVLPTEESSGGE